MCLRHGEHVFEVRVKADKLFIESLFIAKLKKIQEIA